jgi:hypothetical protein
MAPRLIHNRPGPGGCENAWDRSVTSQHRDGWRCRFDECVYSGGTDNGGGFLDIDHTPGCYVKAVNMISIGGAVIRCTNGNEIQLTGCRSEGARQIAAYYFKDTSGNFESIPCGIGDLSYLYLFHLCFWLLRFPI